MLQRRVLLVDDIAHDTIAFQRMVENAQPTWAVVVADGLEQAIVRLGQPATFDLVVGAVRLRTGQIESLLENNLCGGAQTPPLVVLAAPGEEELAAQALRAGAADCVVKDAAQGYLTLLPITLERVLARVDQTRRLNEDGEPALRELRLFQRALADCAVSIALADATSPELPLCYVNDAFEKLTGYTRAEALGANCRILQGGETDQPGLHELRAALDEQRATSVLVRNFRKDGTPFWNYLTVTPLVDADGRLTHFMGVQTDVTAQKLVEEEHYRYLQFMQHAQTPMSMVTLEGDVIFFNPAAVALIGAQDPAQLVGRPVVEFYAPEDADRVLHDIMPIVMTEGHWQGENRVRQLDGTLVDVEQVIFAIRSSTGEVTGYGTSMVDIRERKRVENALRISEERYRSLVENTDSMLSMYTEDGVVVFTNSQSAQSLGLTTAQMTGMTQWELFPAEVAAEHMDVLRQVIRSGKRVVRESRSDRMGKERWLRTSIQPVRDGEQVCALVNSVDITPLKAAEAAVRVNEAQLQALLHSQTSYVVRIDQDGYYSYWNEKFAQDFEWARAVDGSLRVPALSTICDYHHALARETADKCFAHPGQVYQVELDKPTPNQGVRTTLWEFVCLLDVEGQPSSIQCIGFDITDRKHAEETLRASEMRFRRLLQTAPMAVMLCNLQAEITLINVRAEELLGYQSSELVGSPVQMLVPDTQLENYQWVVEQFFAMPADERRAFGAEMWVQCKDGAHLPVEVKLGYLTNGTEAIVMIFLTDISERLASQAQLRESEERYRSLVESSDTLIVMVDETGTIQFANERGWQQMGIAPVELQGSTLYDLLEPATADLLVQQCRAVIEHGVGVVVEPTATNGPELRVFRAAIQPVRDAQGKVVAALINGIDISDIRRAEWALRESEARYRQMFELHGLPQLIINPDDGAIEDANPAAARYYGQTVDNLRRMSMFDLSLTPETDMLREMSLAASADVTSCLCNQRTAGDIPRRVEVFTGPLHVQGRQMLYAIVTDITEREEAKAALEVARDVLELRVIERTAELAQVRDRLAAILDSSGDGIVVLDADLTIMQANRTFGMQFGLPEGQLMGLRMVDLLAAEARMAFSAGVAEAQVARQVFRMEAVARRPDGMTFDVEIALAPVSGDTTSLVCSIHDITLRKRAELAVAEERNLLRTVIDTAPAYIYVKDTQHRIVMNNVAHAQSMGLSDPAAAVGKTDWEIFPHELAAKFMADEARLLATGEAILFTEERSFGRDGTEIWALTSKVPLCNMRGEIIGLVGITWDITALKESESALRASEALYRATIEALSEGIVVQALDGSIQVCNPAAEQILGLTADQMMGRTSIDPRWGAIHEDGSPFPGETHPAMVTLRTGAPQTNVIMGVHKPDGGVTWISINSRLVRQEGDALPYGVVATFTDITARRQSEAALRASDERLHLATQAAEIGVWDWDLVQHTTLWDAQHYTIFGVDPATYDLAEEGWWRSIHPEDVAILQERIEQWVRGGLQGEVAFRIVRPDGEVRQVESMATLVRDAYGKPARLIGVTQDVTERRAAELALRQSQTRLALATDAGGIGIWEWDVLRDELTWDARNFALFGYRPEDGISPGEIWLKTCHPEDFELLARVKRDVLAGTCPYDVEHRVIWPDGSVHYLHSQGTVVRNAHGQAIRLIGVGIDLTARVRAEAALRESEERLHLAAQAGGIGVWDWDLSRQHVLWDARMYDLFGLRAGEDDPIQAWRGNVHSEDMPQVDAALELAFSGVRPYDVEFRVMLPTGGVRYVHSIATVLRDGQGTPMRMIGIGMDVTARREAEEALQRALAQERELGDLKSRFVSMASHELRTPLAAILATTETLSIYREKMSGDQVNARLDRIRQQVMHMKAIMEDVLHLTRLQAGRVEFAPTEGDLSALCQELVEEYAAQPGNAGRLRAALPTYPVVQMFDHKLMRQTISNLIGNALKYSPPDAAVEVRLTQTAEMAVLSVQDRGIGIPPEDQVRIFDPFHRARNVGAIAGTGLGLSITKQAVELHQGTIRIDSQVGKGTTMIVTLPTALRKVEQA